MLSLLGFRWKWIYYMFHRTSTQDCRKYFTRLCHCAPFIVSHRCAHTMLYNLALHKLNSLEADTLYEPHETALLSLITMVLCVSHLALTGAATDWLHRTFGKCKLPPINNLAVLQQLLVSIILLSWTRISFMSRNPKVYHHHHHHYWSHILSQFRWSHCVSRICCDPFHPAHVISRPEA
jgi:hypothetical protein